MKGEKFHVLLERKIGGYSLLSTSRTTQWSERWAKKPARDINLWIFEGREHWVTNYLRAEVVAANA